MQSSNPVICLMTSAKKSHGFLHHITFKNYATHLGKAFSTSASSTAVWHLHYLCLCWSLNVPTCR